jgi:hypothetical protein
MLTQFDVAVVTVEAVTVSKVLSSPVMSTQDMSERVDAPVIVSDAELRAPHEAALAVSVEHVTSARQSMLSAVTAPNIAIGVEREVHDVEVADRVDKTELESTSREPVDMLPAVSRPETDEVAASAVLV